MKNLFYILFLFIGYFLGSSQTKEQLVINYLPKSNLEREPQSEKTILIAKSTEQPKQEPNQQNKEITKQKTKQVIQYYVNHKPNYNFRIRGLVGYGMNGNYSIIDSNSSVNFNQEKGLIYGLGLDYKLNEHYSIGVQYLSNESVLSSFGYDF